MTGITRRGKLKAWKGGRPENRLPHTKRKDTYKKNAEQKEGRGAAEKKEEERRYFLEGIEDRGRFRA